MIGVTGVVVVVHTVQAVIEVTGVVVVRAAMVRCQCHRGLQTKNPAMPISPISPIPTAALAMTVAAVVTARPTPSLGLAAEQTAAIDTCVGAATIATCLCSTQRQ